MIKRRKIGLLGLLLTLLSACTVQTVKDQYIDETSGGKVTEYSVNVKSNIDLPEDGIYKVYKYIEDNTFYIFTKSRVGNAIQNAYQVLKDGTKKVIENINNFLIDKNIAHVELDLEPGVPVTGLELSGRTYTALFLGNKINTRLSYNILPQDASNQHVKFFTSNKEVLEVDGRGNITIKKAGTATVTVITLEGGFKEMCLFKIEDGEIKRKDTVEFDDYTSNALVGNRYDDPSGQESKFTAVTKGPFGDGILAVGTRTLRQDEYVSVVYYGIAERNGITVEIDPGNTIFSETLLAIAYSDYDEHIYTVGHAQLQSESSHSGLIGRFKFVDAELGKEIEPVGIPKTYQNSDVYTQFLSVVAVEEYIYAAAIEFNDPGQGFKTTEPRTSNSYIYKFDHDLELIEKTLVPGLNRISKIGYNEQAELIYFVGEDKNGVGIMGEFFYGNTKEFRTGSTSMTQGIKFNDIIPVGKQTYVAVGEAIVNGERKANIHRFTLDSNEVKFNSTVTNFNLHDKTYNIASFNSLLFNDGIVSVVGFAELFVEEKAIWYNPTTWFNRWSGIVMYGLAINFDVDLHYVSGFKYFNDQENKGKRQAFNDAILTSGGTVTAVGYSNYSSEDNADVWYGYIQFDVSLLGIDIIADYPND